MELTSLTEKQVDQYVDAFSVLMGQRTRAAFTLAAQTMQSDSEVIVASPIDALGAIVTSWKASVTNDLMPFLKNVFVKAGKTVTAPLGNTALDPASAMILLQMETSLTEYANDLYSTGHLAVMVGWQDGETVMAMADRLNEVPKQKENKTHSIAQTLITTAVNGGEWEHLLAIAAKYNTITTKEWVATHDSHTRPTHEAADGQIVPLGAKFSVGNSLLDFPGDPFGDLDEIINCRCTTKYDAEIQAVNSGPQTSPDALSADSAVDTTEQILASAATNSNWKSSDHPRGKNGRFIKKGVGLPNNVFDGLTKLSGGDSFNDFSMNEKESLISSVPDITPEQWANLTDDQKLTIETAIDDALEQNWPGSATAQLWLDNLNVDSEDNDDDIFDPSTPLPNTGTSSSAVDKAAVVNDIKAAYADGDIDKEKMEELLDFSTLMNFPAEDLQQELDEAILEGKSPANLEKKQVKQEITDAFNAGEINSLEHDTLQEFLADDTAPPHVIKQQLENVKKPPIGGPAPTSAHDEGEVNFVKMELHNAYLDDDITQDEHDQMLSMLTNGESPASVTKLLKSTIAGKSTATAPAPAPAPITTGTPPKEIKITHGLIHAKHAPGTTIAVSEDGHRVVWNGSSYDIIDDNGDVVAENIKKSKLYALLNDYYPGKTWHEASGKQETEVSHATPLDAAPPANPIPHPVNFPAPSSVDTALDDAFGPLATGVATPSTPSTPAVAQGMDMTGWVQVGGQAGSNKGALFQAPDGKRYYVKSLKSKEHAQNEVLAAALYRAAGINVPEVRHVTAGAPPGWSNVIASPIVPNAKSNKIGLTKPGKFKEQAQQSYAVNAWLANFDVVGLSHDNIVDSDGKPWLIDVGGSMAYRAQGNKKKPGDWTEDPSGALAGLRDPNVNAQAASVFGDMTYEQQRESAKALLGITDAQIDQLVKDAGLPAKQAAILKARRDAILKHYGLDKNNASTSNAPAAAVAPTNNPTGPVDDPIANLLETHAATPIVITPMTDAPALSQHEQQLQLGELPTTTAGELVDSLNKIHAVGGLTDQDHQDLVKGVTEGKLFMGKMVVGMHNSKVQAANNAVPDPMPTAPITTSHTDLTPDSSHHVALGQELSMAYVDGHITMDEYDSLIEQLDAIDVGDADALNALQAKVNDAVSVSSTPSFTGPPVKKVAKKAAKKAVLANNDVPPHMTSLKSVLTQSSPPSWLVVEAMEEIDQPTWNKMSPSQQASLIHDVEDAAMFSTPGSSSAMTKIGELQDGTWSDGSSSPMPIGDEVAAMFKLQKLLADNNDPSHDEIINAVEGMTQALFDKLAPWHKGNLQHYLTDAVTNGTPGAKHAYAKHGAFQSGYGDTYDQDLETDDDLNTPSSTSSVDVANIPGSKKYDFYQHFKAENVSPAWSGAKIYKSMQAAKLKMASDPQFANLTDEQLLEILDQQHEEVKGLAPGAQAYSAKVKAWLATPAGQKAFAQLNPNIATPPSGFAKKMTNPFSKATAAKAVKSAPVSMNDASLPSTSHAPLSTDAKVEVFGKFKAASHGKYLKDNPADIYWNAVQQAKLQGTTAGKILEAIDEEGAKNLGVANAGLFHKKVSDWLNTPSGQAKAKEIKAGTWSPATAATKKVAGKKITAKKVSGGGVGGHTHAANKPLNEKVPNISSTVPPYDPNKPASDFPVISTSQAQAMQNAMEAQHGAMTGKQKASLKHYTTNAGFTNMNNYLRGYSGGSETTDTHVKNAQAGMRPSTQDVLLHRGNGYFGDWTSFENIKAKEGTTFRQESFFSTSVGGNAAFGGSISMEIEAPAGTPMAYVNAFSAYGDKTGGGKGEREILLAADLEYKILSVKKNGYQTVVRMRVVPKGSS